MPALGGLSREALLRVTLSGEPAPGVHELRAGALRLAGPPARMGMLLSHYLRAKGELAG